MLLPSPVKYSQSFRDRELTEFAQSQIENILLKLRQAHIYTEEDRQRALDEKFWWEPQDISSFAPTPIDSSEGYIDAMEF